jgi:four helix bundle protein
MKNHKDLDVWKYAVDFSVSIYRATEKFPKSELYGLVSQLRRASVSIPSNIAEGSARQTKREYVQFLYCALGSASEIETQVEISSRLGYIAEVDLGVLLESRDRIARMLFGMIRKWKK